MKGISEDLRHFLEKQHFVIVSSLDEKGSIHTSIKGILEADTAGKIFLLDVYKARTYRNIKNDPRVALTAVDEHRYRAYSLSGSARVITEDSVSDKRQKAWHDKLSKRIAKRVIRHVKGGTAGHEGIPEAKFPVPKYIIEVSVEKIVDLAPQRSKGQKE